MDLSQDVSYPTHYKRFVFKMFTFVAPELATPGKGTPKDQSKGGADPQIMVPLNEKV